MKNSNALVNAVSNLLMWLLFAHQWTVAHACGWPWHSQEWEKSPHETGNVDVSWSSSMVCRKFVTGKKQIILWNRPPSDSWPVQPLYGRCRPAWCIHCPVQVSSAVKSVVHVPIAYSHCGSHQCLAHVPQRLPQPPDEISSPLEYFHLWMLHQEDWMCLFSMCSVSSALCCSQQTVEHLVQTTLLMAHRHQSLRLNHRHCY